MKFSPINNPKEDILDSKTYAKIELHPLINTLVIELKRSADGRTDRHKSVDTTDGRTDTKTTNVKTYYPATNVWRVMKMNWLVWFNGALETVFKSISGCLPDREKEKERKEKRNDRREQYSSLYRAVSQTGRKKKRGKKKEMIDENSIQVYIGLSPRQGERKREERKKK